MVMSMNGAASTKNGVTSSNGNRPNNGLQDGGYIIDSPLSNSSLDLIQVREQVREEDEGKWDATVFRDQLVLLNGKLLIPEPSGGNIAEELTPTTWATSQMCGRLGIPTAYFRRCPLDLQDAQFNVWARQHDRFESSGYKRNDRNGNGDHPGGSGNERWLLRVKHDSLRGVLSDRYTRLDNELFLDCLEPLVPSRLQVKWFALTGESLHLRLIDPTLAREVLPDDRIMVGLHIANSEVGKRSVTVDAIVWRLVCQNGLVRLVKGKSLLQQRHIFVSQSNFKRDLERAMGEALTTAAGLLEKMAQATTEHLDDIETVIEKIGERHQLSEAFQEKIKNALLLENRGQQETLYGLTNALTQAAQTLPPDDRYGMEVMAGEVMERGAIWLNGLPKAKARRKIEMAGANSGASGGSSFVSDSNLAAHSTARSMAPVNGHEMMMSKMSSEGSPPKHLHETSFVRLAEHLLPARVEKSSGSISDEVQKEVQDQAEKSTVNPRTRLAADSFMPVRPPAQLPASPAITASISEVKSEERKENKPTPAETPIVVADANVVANDGAEVSLASRTQKDVICALCSRRGLGTYDLHYLIQQECDKNDLEDLTQVEATQLTVLLQQKPLSELLAPIPEYDEDGELLNDEEE